MRTVDNQIARRNADFHDVFSNVLKSNPEIVTEDAIRIAIHSPAKEFYFSQRKAVIYCSLLYRKEKIPLKRHSEKRLAISNIYRRARTLMDKSGMPLSQAVVETIYSPAPRFYFNKSTAYSIIRKIARQRK